LKRNSEDVHEREKMNPHSRESDLHG